MSPRSDDDWARDLVEAIDAIDAHRRNHRGLDDAMGPSATLLLVDAMTYRLMAIGEAAKNLSPDARAAHPEIPWRNIVGLRDHLAHHYHRRDPRIVMSTVDDGFLEPLRAAAQSMLRG